MKWTLFGFGYFVIEVVMRAMVGPVIGPPELSEIVWYAGKAILVTVALSLAFAVLHSLWLLARHLLGVTKDGAVGATRVAPYVAGRTVSTIERTASDAAAAFKAGRDR